MSGRKTSAAFATKADLETHRADTTAEIREVRHEMSGMRADLRSEIHLLRVELKGDIAGLRTELKGDINDLRTELKGDISDLRTELKGDINNLRTEVTDQIHVLGVRFEDLNAKFDAVLEASPRPGSIAELQRQMDASEEYVSSRVTALEGAVRDQQRDLGAARDDLRAAVSKVRAEARVIRLTSKRLPKSARLDELDARIAILEKHVGLVR